MSDRLLKESDVLEAILGWETDPLDEELERAVKAIPSADTSECTCCEYRVGDLCCYSDVDIKQGRPQGEWIAVSAFDAFGGDEATWMAHGNPTAFHYCSECKEQARIDEFGEEILSNFCPHCGSRNRKENE